MTFTMRMALTVTALSLGFLVLGVVFSLWGPERWLTIAGICGMIGITGLAQALLITLFALRR